MFEGLVVKECRFCGHENPEGEFRCIQCGKPLNGYGARGSETYNLDDDTDSANFPRWGTARLGAEHKLLLHVRGFDEPLVVPVLDTLILGRYDCDSGETPDVDLAPYDAQNYGVSRRHAAILIEDEALKIMDLGSANATYMNGQKLIAHQARILRDGDELRLARLVIRVNFA